MSNRRPAGGELVQAPVSGAPAIPSAAMAVDQVVELWLAGVAESSRQTYRGVFEDFARYLGLDSASAAAVLLGSRMQAQAQVLGYRAALLEKKMAPSTVNLRIAALRSLVAHAQSIGLVEWSLSVKGVRSTPYRDTRGPGREGFQLLVRAAKGKRRDLAIIWLLYSMALRRGEVAGLDFEHVAGDRLLVRSKGARGEAERVPLTIPRAAQKALNDWLRARGDDPGPLFLNHHCGVQEHGRLSTRSIARMLKQLGMKAGIGHVRPHGLRHTAITEALRLCGGNVRRVQLYSRHKDPRTVVKYDDNRLDQGGAVAAQVADDVDDDEEES